MALKPHIDPLKYQVGFFVNTVAERGGILVATTGQGVIPGSGAAMDNFYQMAEYGAAATGRFPLGMLLDDFVNKDLTEIPLNRFKSERQIGDKASIMQKGEAVTNQLWSAGSVTPGQTAYLSGTGTISPVQVGLAPVVGKFLSRPDADGYAKVFIDL